MISPEQAWQRIEEHLQPLEGELVERRRAVDRVLTEPLSATVDVPAHDVSAMDGFAVAKVTPPGERLRVQGTVAAGNPPGATLEPGAAWRIMTGAPVPRGADRVIPVEQTKVIDTRLQVQTDVDEGAHIRRHGEVLRRGMQLLTAGTPLTPGAMSLLATHGHEQVTVHRQPRVATLATGNEVVPPEIEPRSGELRDSHTDFLLAAARSLGLEFDSLGIAPDRPEAIRDRVAKGLESDVLLISGGVSKGEFDYVEEVLGELECSVLFDAVAMQPGKPLVVARHPGGLVFGLPGNPASVMVGFWLFVRPTLRRLQGLQDGFWHGALSATLDAQLPGAKGRDRFLSAEVRFEAGRALVTPRLAKGSHDLSAFARGSALVRIPAHSEPTEPGETCHILPFANWASYRSTTS